MATYDLTLIIDREILRNMSTDNLNIARKVNGSFTTVFTGASIKPKKKNQQLLLEVNAFEWTEEYSVFLSKKYAHGTQVSIATLPQKIQFGQKTVFDSNLLDDAEHAEKALFRESSAKDSFVMVAVPSFLRAAVSTKVNGKWAPIYVDEQAHNGTINKELTPINEYALFWSNKVVTGSIIDYSQTKDAYVFSFPSGSTSMTLRYGYQEANNQINMTEEPDWYHDEL